MTHHFFDHLIQFVSTYGYWAVAGILLLENAGVPVPGETVLLAASFVAASSGKLHLGWLILVASLTCTVGGSMGYWVGRRGGRPLLERYAHVFHVSAATLGRGETLFQRFGSATVLVARFVFGLRVFAGPLAGVMRMPVGRFLLCNLVGATLWSAVICFVGYSFGQHWHGMLVLVRKIDGVILVMLVVVLLVLWARRRFWNPNE